MVATACGQLRTPNNAELSNSNLQTSRLKLKQEFVATLLIKWARVCFDLGPWTLKHPKLSYLESHCKLPLTQNRGNIKCHSATQTSFNIAAKCYFKSYSVITCPTKNTGLSHNANSFILSKHHPAAREIQRLSLDDFLAAIKLFQGATETCAPNCLFASKHLGVSSLDVENHSKPFLRNPLRNFQQHLSAAKSLQPPSRKRHAKPSEGTGFSPTPQL